MASTPPKPSGSESENSIRIEEGGEVEEGEEVSSSNNRQPISSNTSKSSNFKSPDMPALIGDERKGLPPAKRPATFLLTARLPSRGITRNQEQDIAKRKLMQPPGRRREEMNTVEPPPMKIRKLKVIPPAPPIQHLSGEDMENLMAEQRKLLGMDPSNKRTTRELTVIQPAPAIQHLSEEYMANLMAEQPPLLEMKKVEPPAIRELMAIPPEIINTSGKDMADIMAEKQRLMDMYKPMPPPRRREQTPAPAITGHYLEDDDEEGDELLFSASRTEAEENYETLKLIESCRKSGDISPPIYIRRRQDELQNRFEAFVRVFGSQELPERVFPTPMSSTNGTPESEFTFPDPTDIEPDRADESDLKSAIALSLAPETKVDDSKTKTDAEDDIPLKKRTKQINDRKMKAPIKVAQCVLEEEDNELLLPFSESEIEDDYETLKILIAFTLTGEDSATCSDNVLKDFINGILGDSCKVTAAKSRQKVTKLSEKYISAVDMHGKDGGGNFATREYEIFAMSERIWGYNHECEDVLEGSQTDLEGSRTNQDLHKQYYLLKKLVYEKYNGVIISPQTKDFYDLQRQYQKNLAEEGRYSAFNQIPIFKCWSDYIDFLIFKMSEYIFEPIDKSNGDLQDPNDQAFWFNRDSLYYDPDSQSYPCMRNCQAHIFNCYEAVFTYVPSHRAGKIWVFLPHDTLFLIHGLKPGVLTIDPTTGSMRFKVLDRNFLTNTLDIPLEKIPEMHNKWYTLNEMCSSMEFYHAQGQYAFLTQRHDYWSIGLQISDKYLIGTKSLTNFLDQYEYFCGNRYNRQKLRDDLNFFYGIPVFADFRYEEDLSDVVLHEIRILHDLQLVPVPYVRVDNLPGDDFLLEDLKDRRDISIKKKFYPDQL